MGILADVMQIKKFEREQELADINAIGTSVNNFINVRNQSQQLQRQASIDDLSRRNIESQIESRKPSALDELLTKGKAFEAAKTIAKNTGDRSALDALIGTPEQAEPRDSLDPLVAQDTPRVQDLLPQQEAQGVDGLLPQGQAQQVGQGIERDIVGDLTEVGKVQLGLQEQKAKSVITGNAAVDLQELKKGAEIRRNMFSGRAKSDLTTNEFLKFAIQQQKLFGKGLKQGPLSGFLANTLGKVSGKFRNKFFESFQGSTIEFAAFVGRNAMPGTRAARIIDLFRETAPNEFSTMTGGIRNAALSWGEVIATDFGPEGHANEYIPGFSNMSVTEQTKATEEVFIPYMNEQIEVFEKGYLIDAYKASPDLFNEKEQNEIQNIIREDIRENLRGQ